MPRGWGREKHTWARKHTNSSARLLSASERRCRLPRLACPYSAGDGTFLVREERPQKQVASSSLLNKWYPQKPWYGISRKGCRVPLVIIYKYAAGVSRSPSGSSEHWTWRSGTHRFSRDGEKKYPIYLKKKLQWSEWKMVGSGLCCPSVQIHVFKQESIFYNQCPYLFILRHRYPI